MSAFSFGNFILDQSRFWLILLSMVTFMLGLYMGKRAHNVDSISLWEDCIVPTRVLSSTDEENLTESSISSTEAEFFFLSNKKFACNAQLAYDQLSRLHKVRVKLDEHKKRGDANRARIGTIDRKATAAEAAEDAFRSCISVMMPELLEYWDEKGTRTKTHLKKWDDTKEKAIDGVTFDVLMQTAEELDKTVD